MTLRWICGSLLAVTQLISAQPGRGQAPAVPTSPSLTGYSAPSAAIETDWEKKFQAGICARQYSREHAALERASASRWLAVRQGQRRMDALEI